jgi:hypothetical protein
MRLTVFSPEKTGGMAANYRQFRQKNAAEMTAKMSGSRPANGGAKNFATAEKP